jgi:hypothetical protein
MPYVRKRAAENLTTTACGIDALPPEACALFGAGLFDGAAWFQICCAAGTPAGATAEFVTVWRGDRPIALFPMLRDGVRCGAFTTPYTCLWRPMLAPGADPSAVGHAFGQWCRRWATLRLDALDLDDPVWGGLREGLKEAGLAILPFAHFGNWRVETGGAPWAAYLAERPGHIREALRRRGKRLLAAGATMRVVTGPDEVEAGIAAYEAVYAASWKVPEPFPAFSATLMREGARAGWLRLGLLEQGDHVLAAQIWMVLGSWATVLKLAHDEAHKAASPGTVLTGFMIARLLEQEHVTELDFGRGDDAYKQAWATDRRQRYGLVIAHPRRLGGIGAILRDWAKQKASSSFLKKRTKKLLRMKA